ncbi:MAG: CAP domain-containing protein [Hyphomonadaceae bacterium]
MLRFVFLAFISLAMSLPMNAQGLEPASSATCDTHSTARGEHVHDYAPRAMACVEAPTAGYWYDAVTESEMFDLVNAERRARGLTQLSYRAELLAPARVHSFDMAQDGFFAHRGADGRSPFERISALDRTLVQSEARENLASVSGQVEDTKVAALLHDLLMNSEGHRANILAPNLTHMAMGFVRTAQGAWVTQVFVRQDGVLDEPLGYAHTLGDRLALGAQLEDREFRSAVFQGKRGQEYTSFQSGDIPTGDLQLLVIGTQQVDAYTTRTVKLNGPSMSIIPARSSGP